MSTEPPMRNPMRRFTPLLLCLALASVSRADEAANQEKPIPPSLAAASHRSVTAVTGSGQAPEDRRSDPPRAVATT